jgi:hypothetical protein
MMRKAARRPEGKKMGRQFNSFIILALIVALAASCTAVSKYTADQENEFEQATAQLDTPEKINDWLVKNFVYDWWLLISIAGIRFSEDKLQCSVIKYPIRTYYDKKGLCHDAANLAGYSLQKAGYKIEIVTAIRNTPFKIFPRSHTLCAFERAGKWWVIGDTRGKMSSVRKEIAGPFDSIKEVANYAVDGNSREYRLTRRRGF